MQNEEKELKEKIEITQTDLKRKHDELQKIAINCINYQTILEFLEELVQEEETQKENGYKKRIELYRKMIKEKESILKDIQI